MGTKGVPHRKWSKEEKLIVVKKHLEEHISIGILKEKQASAVHRCRHGSKPIWLLQMVQSQGHPNRYEQDRILLTQLLQEEHQKHTVMGYHALAKNIYKATGWMFSDNLAHKCCKVARIHSQARTRKYRKPGGESLKYENLLCEDVGTPLDRLNWWFRT